MRPLVIVFAMALLARAEVTYKIRLTSNEGNRIVELPAEKYVAAVLAGESSTFHSDESLKAMAVAARTYAARLRGRHKEEGFDFCATTHCQRAAIGDIPARLVQAAAATAGELLWSGGKPAFAVYTRDCGGKTEAAKAVWPNIDIGYLVSHSDPYCTRHGASVWTWSAEPKEIVQALQSSQLLAPAELREVVILRRTESKRAQMLNLEGASSVRISAGSFRFAIGRELGWNTLRSDQYEVQNADDTIRFHGRGQGHGVGLCQLGAEEMGTEGRTYREILAFYYPGTAISRRASGFRWVRLGGEGVTVLTTRPEADRKVLTAAERAKAYAARRLRMAALSEIVVRVYADLDSFRNATGEPGWVAAHSRGNTIDLQPPELLLRSGALIPVLQHEMLHAILESQASRDLPTWFREGLVEWLAREKGISFSPLSSSPPDLDKDIRQREWRGSAERAYAEAEARVAALVSHYGEAAVLDWAVRGLPAEVKNSSERSAATKSK